MAQSKILVLASTSPRRRQLIALGGWMFNTAPASIDETPIEGENPQAYVLRMAINKAFSAAGSSQIQTDSIVLGADTTVIDNAAGSPVILGKPANAKDAFDMLQQLRGRTHQVYTAIAALQVSDGAVLTDVCVTDVTMRNYSDEEIHRYVASGDPMDKAGAYAIQNEDFQPVEGLAGCYANVVGLPLCSVARTLAKLDLPARTDVVRYCQPELDYRCTVFNKILRGDA